MHWIFFGCKPQKELKTAEMLENLGFTATVPMLTERKRIRRQRVVEHSARVLLPGNVFLGFEDFIPWGDLRRYHPWPLGRLRMHGDKPAMLKDADMLRLDELVLDSKQAEEIFQVGETVKALAQGFEGLEFEIVDVTDSSVFVEGLMFGAPRKMKLPKAHVLKVS